jgi:hypothetical protein
MVHGPKSGTLRYEVALRPLFILSIWITFPNKLLPSPKASTDFNAQQTVFKTPIHTRLSSQNLKVYREAVRVLAFDPYDFSELPPKSFEFPAFILY